MTPKISYQPVRIQGNPLFSIIIPSWNNLPYLKCCVESIRKNSKYEHQIIVHVNEGKDGTRQWVEQQGLAHTFSPDNSGVCYGFNAPAALATCNYLLLSDDDYYFAPGWDEPLFREATQLGNEYFCLTGTMIEHSPSRYPTSIIDNRNYGKTVQEFDERRFLREFENIAFADWNGGNWYPMLLHRRMWQLIGGLSTEFTPGMASDPDMMMKLWHAGVRYYKGISKSRVYHFGSKSTARVKKNDGNKQFLLKWGLSKSTFFDHYLRLGQPFAGATPEPDAQQFTVKLNRDKLKRLFSVWKK